MSSPVSRRTFLEGAATLVGVALVGGCSSNSSAQPKAQAKGDGFLLAKTTLPKAGEATSFSFPDGQQGLLFHALSGETGAISARCTHLGCVVQWTEGNTQTPFVCPCHQSEFDLHGGVLKGPAKAPLAHFRARQNGEDVELQRA